MNLRAILRGGLAIAMFLVGLSAGCWAIREALPFPDVPLVRAKIEHLARHHDDYDTLFIGSSRLYYQIIPAIFDRLNAERGMPTRTFNAGIAGMRPPEDAYYLDTIFRHPPKNLRWVFIELAGLRTAVDRDKIGTVRAVYWHDLPRLVVLFKRALYLKPEKGKRKWKKIFRDLGESLGEFSDHVALFVRNEINLGRGSILTNRLSYYAVAPATPAYGVMGKDLAGWIPTGRPEEIAGQQLVDFDAALADRKVKPAVRDYGDPVSQRALETMIAKIEKLGAQPVLVVPPTTNKRNFFPRKEREKKTLVLDFCDIQKFPELYEHRYRLDTDHLNTEGAEVFTRLFVKTWAEELERRK